MYYIHFNESESFYLFYTKLYSKFLSMALSLIPSLFWFSNTWNYLKKKLHKFRLHMQSICMVLCTCMRAHACSCVVYFVIQQLKAIRLYAINSITLCVHVWVYFSTCVRFSYCLSRNVSPFSSSNSLSILIGRLALTDIFILNNSNVGTSFAEISVCFRLLFS